MKIAFLSVLGAACVAGALAGCGSDSGNSPNGQEGAVMPGDAQTPPTGEASAISAWLTKGDYKAWKCEPASHDARSPSPHGKNRICSNTVLSTHGAGEYPVGAAGVKELYNAAGTSIVGYAMYRKVAAGQGEAWYWFEQIDGDLVANGLGTSGTPKTVCVGCHAGAGSDANHSGHDLVYTQVM